MKSTIRVAVVGCGNRGTNSYAPYVDAFEGVEIVAAAEPIQERRESFAKRFGLRPDQCYETAEEFFSKPRMAEVAFICTQDQQHYDHVMSAMRLGYDVLLEKPVSNVPEHCIAIADEAKRLGRNVVVCHVLRYTPFYQKIKETITSGRIGQVMSLHQFEEVGWGHYAHSFTRGLWRNSEETSPMILAKCCHDMDIILWLVGEDCKRVSSFGHLTHFKAENAPAGSELRCNENCSAYDTCPYNAKKIYFSDKWQWAQGAVTLDPTPERVEAALQEGQYGRCVYHCDNNVVDHQIVNMQFDKDITASLTMCAFTNDMTRELKIMGTRGEITGNMEKNEIRIRVFGEPEEVIDVTTLSTDLSGHGGGENRLLRDLFNQTKGVADAVSSLTSIEKSVQSHIMAFAAERSRLEDGRVVALSEIYQDCALPTP